MIILLCWTWIRVIFKNNKNTMSIVRSLLFLSCLKSDLMVNCCRRTSQPQASKSSVLNTGRRRKLPPPIHTFVKDYVKNNMRSITDQILGTRQNSMDTCKVEVGIQKEKCTNEKLPNRDCRTAETLPKDHHEIIEESPKDDSAQQPKRAPRPNYFIALQVTDSKILENVKRVQDDILEHSDVDLSHMKVDIRKSHITLMAMNLADSYIVNSAKECLDQSLPAFKENSAPIALEFEGLNVFSGGSVLFITIKPSPALQLLISLSGVITKGMKQRGIVGAGNEFKPHVTLMKYRWKKQTRNRAKKVEKAAYKDFAKEYFGSQTISSIQLCKMEGVREDGYYIVEHEVFFDR